MTGCILMMSKTGCLVSFASIGTGNHMVVSPFGTGCLACACKHTVVRHKQSEQHLKAVKQENEKCKANVMEELLLK